MSHAGILYLISSPIGNLSDISLRALDVLAKSPIVAAEYTRMARRLLQAHGIGGKRLISLRAHNKKQATERLITLIAKHGSAAYLSDVGTPGISDPGARLARAAGVRVESVSGASAYTALIAVVGAPDGEIHFLGFPPRAKKKRDDFFHRLTHFHGAVVLFEAPTRIIDAVMRITESLGGDVRLVLGRELTKPMSKWWTTKRRLWRNFWPMGGFRRVGSFPP